MTTFTLFGTSLWVWSIFGAVVLALLALDLGVLHRRDRVIGVKQSLWLSAAYLGVALAFAAWLGWQRGSGTAMAFLTGYVIEKTLALDNVFLIATVFSLLAVPREYQHRVLFWGILGAILSRALLIGLGVTLVSEFHWILYVFGAFLVLVGLRMLFHSGPALDETIQRVLRWMRSHLRMTAGFHGNRFWIRAPADAGDPKSRLTVWVTPLLLALVSIELIDFVFAVDSVPAVFAVTQDPFIVYTSNIFAILGLRALYFCLAALVARFRYLPSALAAVLIFLGAEILAADWAGELPTWASLLVTLGLLCAGVLYSLYRTRASVPQERLAASRQRPATQALQRAARDSVQESP